MEKVGKVEMVKETSDPGFNLGRKIQGNHIVFYFSISYDLWVDLEPCAFFS